MKRITTISPTRKRTPSDRTSANRRSRAQVAPAETAPPPRRVEPQQAHEQTQAPAPQAGAAESDAGSKQRLAQSCVAKILEKLLKGGLDECEPALWSQRTFWLLAGTIYQRLAVDCEAIETAELVALAKALAENRRVEGRSGDATNAGIGVEDRPLASKANLNALVRELYGVGMPTVEPADPHREMVVPSPDL